MKRLTPRSAEYTNDARGPVGHRYVKVRRDGRVRGQAELLFVLCIEQIIRRLAVIMTLLVSRDVLLCGAVGVLDLGQEYEVVEVSFWCCG